MKYTLLILSICFSLVAAAQNVGVGTNTPAAKLDITSTNSGVLIPRVALTGFHDTVTVISPVTSTLIYNTATVTDGARLTPGFYYWTGSVWTRLIDNGTLTNIYNNDGSLDGNRTVNLTYDTLTFSSATGGGCVIITADAFVDSVRIGMGKNNVSTNTAVGRSALAANLIAGHNNTAVGQGSLAANTSGYSNTAIGTTALNSNLSGVYNLAVGDQTLHFNTVGSANTAIGASALYLNTANANTAVGSEAMLHTTTGTQNVALGADALLINSTGSANTAVGFDALTNSTGSSNTALGASAMINTTTGGFDVAVGAGAMGSNISGSSNTACGFDALERNATGSFNTALGNYSMNGNTSGTYNVGLGMQSLYFDSAGTGNTGIGFSALYSMTNGVNNTALGYSAGASIATGSGYTFIGYLSNSSGGLTNATAIGANSYASQSNSLILGSVNGVNGATSSVSVGIGTTTPAFDLDVVGQIRCSRAGGGGGSSSTITAAGSSSASYGFDVTGAGTDQKWWDILAGTSPAMAFRAVNDANSAATTWLQVNRGTGVTISSVGFPAGNVAIGASSTIFPLDVTNTVSASTVTMNHTDLVNGTSYGGFTYVATNGASNLAYVGSDATYAMSIRSAGGVMAPTYFATSDRRIKNISGISCGEQDLNTLKGIQITDYTMRDRIASGNAHYKKVIAQQVREVYPQAVNTSHAPQYVPNIYQCAADIRISEDEISIRMPEAIKADKDIAVGKKCRLFLSEKSRSGIEKEIKGEITSIEGGELTVKVNDMPKENYDAAFVYGTEIDDLLTVDYDAISMLNVSATQELIKKVETLEKENTAQKAMIERLARENKNAAAMQSDIDLLKASVETLQQIIGRRAGE